tara:strand:+ start:327 stop:533 length:207 start_codon:yes stop_codon:yes gene_type:complete
VDVITIAHQDHHLVVPVLVLEMRVVEYLKEMIVLTEDLEELVVAEYVQPVQQADQQDQELVEMEKFQV